MKIFKLDTPNTSYIFGVTDSRHLEHLYYGKRIRDIANESALCEKLGTGLGHSVAYSPEFPNLILNNLCQEYSCVGKGDYREPFVLIESENGFVNDFLFESADYIDDYHPQNLPSSYGKSTTLQITLSDSNSQLQLLLLYSVFDDCDIIVRSARLINNSARAVTIRKLASLQLDLPRCDFDIQTLDGAWAKERYINVRPLGIGITLIDSKCGSSSSTHNPFVSLSANNTTLGQGDCYGFNLIYSGNHALTAEVTLHNKTRVLQGINPFGFAWTLNAGDSFCTPEATVCYCACGRSGLARQYHTFVRNHIIRGVYKDKERPVLINNWEATYFNFTEKKLLELAKVAKSLGIELFVLDDGWFGKRTDDTKGLGDWFVNKAKLPQGLDGLCKKINALGLDFGIWVEPEMVNPDSDLYRAHPDWAVTHPDHHYSLSRNQLLLDLTNAEVREHIVTRLTDIFSSANIKYVKWDFNRPMSDFYSPCLTNQGEFFHRYYLGLYEIMEKLTASFPDILFESCASGGNRVDLALLCYFPQFWTSDNTDSCDRVKIQEGTLTCYPPCTMGAHVSASPNHQTLRSSTIDNRFNTACVGTLGYELDLSKLNSTELKSVKAQIDFYKKWRSVIQKGDYYQLRSIFCDTKAVWNIVSPDKMRSLVGMFCAQAETSPPIDILRIDGIQEDILYTIKTKPQKFPAKQFGDLIQVALPHLAKTAIFKAIIEHGYSLDAEQESYTAYGDLLINAGVKLYQQFSSTGWNEKVRIMMDYGSRLYEVEAVIDKKK